MAIVSLGETTPLLWGMWQDIRFGKYGIDILAATSIIASVILGQYWAAIVIVLMLSGGQALEAYAANRSQSELRALLKLAPRSAVVIRKGKEVIVKVENINVGDKIFLKAGEVVPVDSIVVDGQANFDESSLTGESLPQLKEKQSSLMSGSINIDGVITAKAVASAEDSQYQQIIKLVRSAAASQAPFVRLADRYALPFTIAAYSIGIAMWVISGQAIRFLEVIIVATPCPLILAAPIAFISGMAKASRYGIIVKNGQALERLAEAKAIAFDKTGTLTKGELSVKSIRTFYKFKKEEILKYAFSLEQNSNHLLAKAVIEDAKLKGVKPLKVKHLEEIAGLGLVGDIKSDKVQIGNYTLIKRQKIEMPKNYLHHKINQTAAYITFNDKLAGVITFTDEIRPESLDTLSFLHDLGLKKISMITGDNMPTAKLIADQLGIDKVYADALPADKLHILSQMKPKPVVFVGDGINDAPVLAASDVGIAMGVRGSTAASESADMVVMLDDLSRVAAGLEISKKTFKIAKESIWLGIAFSSALMLVFATGKFLPLYGAITQEFVDVFVIFNALRAHSIKPSMVRN